MTEDFMAARETDLLENEMRRLFVQQRSIEVKTSKYEIKTIKLSRMHSVKTAMSKGT